MPDLSNGYEEEAESFIAQRSSTIGVSIVRRWAQSLPAGARVLDLGRGDGIPVTRTLIEEGLEVYAADASPKMVSAFRRNFPFVPVICQAAESLDNINQKFEAALTWGLIFLLTPEMQKIVIQNVSRALNSGGSFLFTAPHQAVRWMDVRTGRESVSLGISKYQSVFSAAGLSLAAQYNDEGDNHYYEVKKQ